MLPDSSKLVSDKVGAVQYDNISKINRSWTIKNRLRKHRRLNLRKKLVSN
jgi:hypothetical protein